MSLTDLQLQTASPAIDKGISGMTIDIDGNPRPQGSGVEMGCYEQVWNRRER